MQGVSHLQLIKPQVRQSCDLYPQVWIRLRLDPNPDHPQDSLVHLRKCFFFKIFYEYKQYNIFNCYTTYFVIQDYTKKITFPLQFVTAVIFYNFKKHKYIMATQSHLFTVNAQSAFRNFLLPSLAF